MLNVSYQKKMRWNTQHNIINLISFRLTYYLQIEKNVQKETVICSVLSFLTAYYLATHELGNVSIAVIFFTHLVNTWGHWMTEKCAVETTPDDDTSPSFCQERKRNTGFSVNRVADICDVTYFWCELTCVSFLHWIIADSLTRTTLEHAQPLNSPLIPHVENPADITASRWMWIKTLIVITICYLLTSYL